MKHLFFASVLSLVAFIANAQVPKAINYQAVARNSSGQALANQTMKVRIGLSEINASGATSYYSETRTVTTNALGLFNIQIGSAGASNVTGSFNNTNWLNNTVSHNMNVELDINNNNNFVSMGSQELVSVPYALAADKANTANIASSANSLQYNAVSSNTPQNGDLLRWDGTEWTPTAVSTGPSIQTYNLFGSIGSVAPGGATPAWAFIGSTQTVTVTPGQTLNGAFAAALGTTTAGGTANGYLSLCICVQKDGTGPVTPIYSGAYAEFSITGRVSTSCAGTVRFSTVPQTGVLLAGTYKIGLGIRNGSTVQLNNNDFMNGYIMIY